MAYDFRKCLMNRAYASPWDTQRCAFVCYVRARESLRTKKIVLSCGKDVINVAKHRRAQL